MQSRRPHHNDLWGRPCHQDEAATGQPVADAATIGPSRSATLQAAARGGVADSSSPTPTDSAIELRTPHSEFRTSFDAILISDYAKGVRAAAGGYVYHVLNRANARMTIFVKDADYEAFENVLAEAVERTETRLSVIPVRNRSDCEVSIFQFSFENDHLGEFSRGFFECHHFAL